MIVPGSGLVAAKLYAKATDSTNPAAAAISSVCLVEIFGS